MPMCHWLHDIFHHVGHVLHAFQMKNTVRRMQSFLIFQYIVRWIDQYKVHRSNQIIFDSKLEPCHQKVEVHVLNEVQRIHCFDEFSHCCLFLLTQGRRRGGLALCYNIFFVDLLEAGTCTCFKRRHIHFSVLLNVFHVHFALFLRPSPLHTQLEFCLSMSRK